MSKPKTMDGRKMVSLPKEAWDAIEDFRFANRFKSEADAIRQLIQLGLAASAAGWQPVDTGEK